MKYAKRGFYCEKKQIDGNETSTTQAARISRKATSIALKCTISKELLNVLERAIDKLGLEVDNSLSQIPAYPCGISKSSIEFAGDILQGKVSVRAPQVIKGSNEKRAKTVLEKKKGKKNATTKKKGTVTHSNMHFPTSFVVASNIYPPLYFHEKAK